MVKYLGIRYPPEIFSMSHVSIPFPLEDPLYGLYPDTSYEDFGIQLGTLAPRGERGALVVEHGLSLPRRLESLLPLHS